MPVATHAILEARERRVVVGHAIVAVVPSKHARQPRMLLAWRVVASLAHLPSQGRELCVALLRRGAANQFTPSIRASRQDVREAQEVERLGPRPAVESSIPMGKTAEANHPCLVRVQLQTEYRE